ncbi:MAG: hypothetical protein OXG33_11190 [Chloroflexi bacterium]|nr:hypothetical protein [Chloroflexota bacterium]
MAQSSLTTLWELDWLDVAMEALAVQDRLKPLFSNEQRQVAQDRLNAHGYDPATS